MTTIAILAFVLIVYLKRKRQKAPMPIDFESWAMEKSLRNPNSNLEDLLTEYIRENNIIIRHDLDEPERISLARTKIQIIEQSVFGDPKNMTDDSVSNYLMGLRFTVQSYEMLPAEGKEIYKKRQS